MSRISECFSRLARRRHSALIPFITAGDPSVPATVPMMHGLVESGADIIELGVPFTDPMAEGPVIQRASERALRGGSCMERTLMMVQRFRHHNSVTPVVLMGYANPIELIGYARFASFAREAGVDGVITVDMPPDEAEEYQECMRQQQLDTIYLVAPTSSPERIQLIAQAGRGFIYYVSLKGVTGSDKLDVDSLAEKIKIIRSYTQLPVGVGFGIKDAKTAGMIAKIADAVVVGSALIQRLEQGMEKGLSEAPLVDYICELIVSMRQAMDDFDE